MFSFADSGEAQGRLKNRHPVAVIDIGSNSVRIVIFEGLVRAPSLLFNEKVSSGLGRGIATHNRMNDKAVESALSALRRYKALIEQANVKKLFVLATAAAREAENGPAFIEQAEAILKTEIQILSGREEALYSAYGIMSSFRNPNGVVGDLGGGSLELVEINNDQLSDGVTLPLGVIRLQERSENDITAAQKLAMEDLDDLAVAKAGMGRNFYAVGGTWRNIAKLHMAQVNYPLHITHGYSLSPADLTPFLDKLISGDVSKLAGIDDVSKSRRSLLSYGAAALKAVIAKIQPKQIVFSAYGVREGFIYGQLSPDVRKQDALLEAAEELAILRARSPKHARELTSWTTHCFESFGIDETIDEERYRKAACFLADIGWRAHPDYRAAQSLAIIAYGSFVQISHQGRAYIALANYFRYQGLKNDQLAPEIRALTDDRVWNRAKYLGAFFRVAYPFTAAMPGKIGSFKWRKGDNGTMLLVVPKSMEDMIAERPLGRINQLSKVLDVPIEVVVE